MDWLQGTAFSRLDNKSKGVIIIVGQRLHPEDPIGQLQAAGGWHEVRLPAIAEEASIHKLAKWQDTSEYARSPGEPLDPVREGLAVLEQQRASMGAAKFNAQYQQRPEYDHDTLLRWQWFPTYEVTPDFDFLFLSLDPAIATTTTADWSACIVIGVIGDDNYILDVCRHRLGFNDLSLRLDQLASDHRADAILIESGGIGTGLVDELTAQGRHKIEHYRPEGNKAARLIEVLPLIERGRVLLPRHAPWLADFRMEALAFPHGHHDDQVDALSQFLLFRPSLIEHAMIDHVHLNGGVARGDYGVALSQFIGIGPKQNYWQRMAT